MKDVTNEVYESLKKNTAAIAEITTEYKALERKLKNDIYSETYKKNTLRPKLEEIKKSIEKAKEAAIGEAKEIIKEYQGELYEMDNLHPEDMTEDAKFFTSGVKLNSRDLEAILSRNKGNRTMEQMTYRYAEENNIDMGGKHFANHTNEIRDAESFSKSLDTIAKWIDKDNGMDFIDRVFTEDLNKSKETENPSTATNGTAILESRFETTIIPTSI